MKQFFLAVSVTVMAGAAVQAQVKPKTTKPTATVAKSTSIIKNSTDSFSYALGINIANNLKQQGIDKISNAAMQKAMDDIFLKRKPLLDDQQCNTVIQQEIQGNMSKKSAVVKAKGAAFLAANKKKPGVITLPDGLQYEVLKKGEGAVSPKQEDTVVVHYAGTLIDGHKFDNSYDRGEPLTIAVGGVIRGWTEILQKMHIGDKFKVYIPSELGYGDRAAGPDIPGGATLVFEMELLGIKSAAPASEKEMPKQN